MTGLKCRRRKGLEPPRRLSETTGPHQLSAFRVAVLAAKVTKRAAQRKGVAAFITHGAPGSALLPQRTSAGPHVPQTKRTPYTCSRNASVRRAGASVQGVGISLSRYRECRRSRRTRYRSVSRATARFGSEPPTQAVRAELQAAVRSALPDVATAVPAWPPTAVTTGPWTAMPMPVNGEAVTGERRSARAMSRGGVRCRRSRRGRARRTPAANTAWNADASARRSAAGSAVLPVRRCPRRRIGS